MLPSFLSMETVSRGLFTQQLNQDMIASNLAKTYQDPQGYLVNSRERLDTVEGFSLFFGNPIGRFAVGTGPMAQHLTRLRSLFLDTQIQQTSSVLGRAEILTSLLTQVQGIVNGSTGTLDASVKTFAAAWDTLSTSPLGPLDVGLRSAIVNDGVAFATLARNQYNQLQQLQVGLNGQINQTVSDINNILQQLSLLNTQLMTNPGVNVNSLLDARDYALDKLGRLINIQTNFGGSGTVNVFLGSSSISLVDGAGASILQTNVQNPHNPGLVDVTIQSSEGTVVMKDPWNFITGGNLSGELQARDVTLESYKDQVDQIATSVMSITNRLHQSGYAADGITTGTLFFTGTGAMDINVNASLVTDATRALLAAGIYRNTVTTPIATDGIVAQYLGNLPTLLANNFITSQPRIGVAVNPSLVINTQLFAFPPTPGVGTFTVNGSLVTYDTAIDSIDTILAKINAAAPSVDAVFDSTNQVFYMFSNNPVTIINLTGNFSGGLNPWANIKNVLTSTIRMNNGFAPTDPKIIFNSPTAPGYMDSTIPQVWPPIPGAIPSGPNSQAFRITPGTGGSFTISGPFLPGGQVTINWTNTKESPSNLATILTRIGVATGNLVTASFNSNTQTITLYGNTPLPFQIIDNTGNFTVFTGLNGNVQIGNMTSGLLNQITTDLSGQQLIQDQASATLTQLNNAQADLGAIATTPGQHGEPIANEQQAALQSLIAYNAALDVLQVIDQMYADLVGIIGGNPPPNGIFQRR